MLLYETYSILYLEVLAVLGSSPLLRFQHR